MLADGPEYFETLDPAAAFQMPIARTITHGCNFHRAIQGNQCASVVKLIEPLVTHDSLVTPEMLQVNSLIPTVLRIP